MNIEKDFKNTYTKKDFIIYLLNKNILLVLSPIIILVLLVATIFSIINDGMTMTAIVFLLPILLFILSYIQMYRSIKQALKYYSDAKEFKIAITENEYKTTLDGQTTSLPYNELYCYKETKLHLYLYVDQYQSMVIPKREFSDDELNKIKNILTTKMQKKSRYNLSSWLTLSLTVLLVFLIVYNLFI